jgi:hypothetical protein
MNWHINGLEDLIATAIIKGKESHPNEAELLQWIQNTKWENWRMHPKFNNKMLVVFLWT